MKKKKTGLKSTRVAIKFANKGKIENLALFIAEYKRVCQLFVNVLWELESVPKLVPKSMTASVQTWLSSRAIQACAKQASGVVRGTRQKQKQREFVFEQLMKQKKFKQAKRLKRTIEQAKMTKPSVKSIQPELDSRFVRIDLENPTSFDGWCTLTSLGNSLKIAIPFRKTKHFNKLAKNGQLKPGVRISGKELSFCFSMPSTPLKTQGDVLGIDIGIANVFVTSAGQFGPQDKHGHSLSSIVKKLSRKKKGSKSFQRTTEHRKNFINWSVNNLNLNNVSKVRCEDIKHLRKRKRTSRYLSHWCYPSIFEKIERVCLQTGVQFEQTSSIYTSQRCSQCGWVQKANRVGESFKCRQCGFTAHADLNASTNIGLPLVAISHEQRREHPNRAGFYWRVSSPVPIVPDDQKADFVGIS